jgi:hypothetical protein
MSLASQLVEPAATVEDDDGQAAIERAGRNVWRVAIIAGGYGMAMWFQPASRPLFVALWTVLGAVMLLAGRQKRSHRV